MNLEIVLVLGSVGVLILVGVDQLSRKPTLTAALILAVTVQEALVDLSVEFMGFNVGPTDVVYAMVGGAALIRLANTRRLSQTQALLALFAAVCVLSFAFGVVAGPVGPAVNDFRPYLGLVSAAMYFSSVDMTVANRLAISRVWMWGGIALGFLVSARWLARIGGFDLGVFDADFGLAIRAISGSHTFALATCALILVLPGLSDSSPHAQRLRYVGTVLLVVAILLNRRTLWVALAIGLLVLMLRDRRIGRRVAMIAGAVLIVLMTSATVLNPDFDESGDEIALAATDADNLEWRLEGWIELLENGPDDAVDHVMGLPFGSGYSRTIDGVELVSTPHNFYLQTYLRTGILGLIAFLIVGLMTARSLLQVRDAGGLPFAPTHLLILLAILATWILAWLPGSEQGIVIGLAIASVRSERALHTSMPAVRSMDV